MSLARRLALLGIAALVALFLGAIGVYAVQSYTVAQRTSEIGVRMALGASASDVSRMILGRGADVALSGVVLGWGVALLVTGWMENLLFDVPATDFWTYSAVSVALVVAMLAASYLPARRATRIDVVEALRDE